MARFITSLFLVAFCSMTSFGQKSVGVITDLSETERVQSIIDSIVREIDNTTGINLKIASPNTLHVFGISSESAAQEAYQGIQADLIVSIGSVSTKGISKLSILPIPVIGLGIVDPVLQDMPHVNGRSGKSNFTYILTSRNFIKEIESFKNIIDFKTLTVINNSSFRGSIDPEKASALIDSLENRLNIKIRSIQAEDDVYNTVSKIGETDAVFLASLVGKSEAYVKQLSDYFIQEKIPSFSSLRQHVDAGILGTSSGDNRDQQVYRRIGLVADAIFSGINASENRVALSLRENTYLNISTARKLEFSPPFEVMLTVNLVGETDPETNKYSFNEIARIALEKNLDLKISYKDINLSELDIRSNRSLILPSLSSGLTAIQINEERANAIVNSPERALSLDFVLSQVMYSEEALAAVKIAKYLNNAQQYQTQSDVLDVLFETYSLYLNVLSAKTNFNVQKHNLDNTKTNLELAKIRVEIGEANNSDLYRWESEVARATQSLIEAQTVLLTVKLQLNTLLANALEEEFQIKDVALEDDLYNSFRQSPLTDLLTTPDDLKLASDFLVQQSLEHNPNKKQLLENIKAAERKLKLNRRLLYVPTVALQANYSEVLARGGEGSEQPDSNALMLGNGLQDNSWSLGINLSYPLFTGFSRRINKQKSRVELEQLEFANTSLDQNLELSIRASTVNLLSTTTNLRYSKQSAESANQNFLLVQNYYREGAVNITQLIDAQEASLNASLQAAVAVYEYVLANLQLEYAIGQFSMFLTENQLSEFRSQFLKFATDNKK